MTTEPDRTKETRELGLPFALAVAGLVIAGAATPLLAADKLSSCCNVGTTCDGGLFSCGTGCFCDLNYKCAQG
jgi:hypothetical protein